MMQAESAGDNVDEFQDLDDYEMLLQATQQKMKILTDEDNESWTS